eukprot:TRINITY_DN72888_c0_g1_i1.p1 TRINITY_DN72888_c0_g1~~TRINITY_DN72888_c0_g1_i1.p1  ORF type:complete len:398 (-),score=38.64 TRINITY_DN72888_c0_g1_i1:205-1398(-)
MFRSVVFMYLLVGIAVAAFERTMFLDASNLRVVTESTVDEAWTDFKHTLGTSDSKIVVQNVRTAVPGKNVTVELECTHHSYDSVWHCEDPCSFGVELRDRKDNMAGVSERFCHLNSILLTRDMGLCGSDMKNYETQFRGKDMVEVATRLCEHAGFRYQFLKDGAKFPCAKTGVKLTARVVGLFTQGSTYYMSFGFFPLKASAPLHSNSVAEERFDAPLANSQAAWCQAKDIAQATTVATAINPSCTDGSLVLGRPLDSEPETLGRRFRALAPELLEISEEQLLQMKLGLSYTQLRKRLGGDNDARICEALSLAEHLMSNSDGTGHAAAERHYRDTSDRTEYGACPHVSKHVALPLNWRIYVRCTGGCKNGCGAWLRQGTTIDEYCTTFECARENLEL